MEADSRLLSPMLFDNRLHRSDNLMRECLSKDLDLGNEHALVNFVFGQPFFRPHEGGQTTVVYGCPPMFRGKFWTGCKGNGHPYFLGEKHKLFLIDNIRALYFLNVTTHIGTVRYLFLPSSFRQVSSDFP
jgi:hypothetical protein